MPKFLTVNYLRAMGGGSGNAQVSNCELPEGDGRERRQCPSFYLFINRGLGGGGGKVPTSHCVLHLVAGRGRRPRPSFSL